MEVLRALNRRSGIRLSDRDLAEACELWWPKFELNLDEIRSSLTTAREQLDELMEEASSLKQTIDAAYGRRAIEATGRRLAEWGEAVERALETQDSGLAERFHLAGGAEPQLWDRQSRDDLSDEQWDQQDSNRLREFLHWKRAILGTAIASLYNRE